MPALRMVVCHQSSKQGAAMRASERGGRARRSQFAPSCATSRWLACWLLALAGCLNPVPDTDPSVNASESPAAGGSAEPPSGIQTGGGNADGFVDEGEDPSEVTPPPVTDPAGPVDGASPDAGAPPADAGADAASGGPQ